MSKERSAASPSWRSTTKLVVALTFVAIVAALLVRFQYIVGPLILTFILAYLLHPAAGFFSRATPLSWRAAVSVLYLLLIVLILGLLTLGGVGLVQQVQSLIELVQNILVTLPGFVSQFSGQVYHLGPVAFDLRSLDLNAISQQLLSILQPLLGKTGNLVGALAGGAISTFGWGAFILIVSYFILAESDGLRGRILQVDIPGYAEDAQRIGRELSRIWNAFLRGQIIIFVLTLIVYTILLGVLGVRYAIGLAVLAGFAKFLPYIGPAITWIVLGLVTFFQTYKPFGLSPLVYTAIIIVLALVVDQIFDNLIAPRIMAQALRVHPAAVLVAAIVAANLLGILGVVIAAPILATLTLLGQYTLRKMLDQNPWPGKEEPLPSPLPNLRQRLRDGWQSLRRKRR